MSTVTNNLRRDAYVLEDENNPHGSKAAVVHLSTVLDQVFDDQTVTKKTLRTILEEINKRIDDGGIGNIEFPVVSVNGKQGAVTITREEILGNDFDNVDNTLDMDKPLSNPQRAAVLEILNQRGLTETSLIEHLDPLVSPNPHNITLSKINQNGEVTNLIQSNIANAVNTDIKNLINNLITIHNNETTTHEDIRNKIQEVLGQLSITNNNLSNLYDSVEALDVKMNTKENINSKVDVIVNNGDNYTYPTTRAVMQAIGNKILEYDNSIDIPDNYINKVKTLQNIENLPTASVDNYHNMNFIIDGHNHELQVAICIKDPSTGNYTWDINSISAVTKFNDTQFKMNSEGLSLKTDQVAEQILDNEDMLHAIQNNLRDLLPDILVNYYTKNEVDNLGYIHKIAILPGTMNGTIRFYINDDLTTMSEDVDIPGLKRLAFLEYVSENDIMDDAIQNRHLGNKIIEHDNVADKAVAAHNMRANYMTMFANVDDPENLTVKEVSINDMAALFAPVFRDILEGTGLIQVTEATVQQMIDEAFHRYYDEYHYPELHADFALQGNDLVLKYDTRFHQIPDITLNENGEIVLNIQNESVLEHDIEKLRVFDEFPNLYEETDEK